MAVANRKSNLPRRANPRAIPVAADGQAAIASPARAMQDRLAALFEIGGHAEPAMKLPRRVRFSLMFYAGLLAWALLLGAVWLVWTIADALM